MILASKLRVRYSSVSLLTYMALLMCTNDIHIDLTSFAKIAPATCMLLALMRPWPVKALITNKCVADEYLACEVDDAASERASDLDLTVATQ